MDFIGFLVLVYVVFKLGEYYSYYKISKNLVKIKQLQAIHEQIATKQEPKKVSQVLVEKINDSYYGYLDNNFIGQGKNLAEVEKCVLDLIKKNPDKYHDLIVELKEDSK